MVKEISLADVEGLIGTETGLSDWIIVDQTMIDTFAHATDDHQFIHTDPVRAAAESSFGGTIAHGFLTLSLLSAMNYNCLPKIREQTMGINYGFDKVRFMTPVKCGTRVRGRFATRRRPLPRRRHADDHLRGAVEIENERKPALTANWITIVAVRPEGPAGRC